MPRIVIGADIVPTKSNQDLFIQGDVETLIGDELIELFGAADYRILNLECPLADIETPIKKAGMNLIASTRSINGLQQINPDFFCLANNHIFDQGEPGLKSTINCLKQHGVDFAGAGMSIDEASRCFIKTIKGFTIGIYCCTENEFSVAKRDEGGANPYDPLFSFDHVCELKKRCDYCIVLYHGGKEFYRYPTPMMQRVFRKFSDAGADVVIAQHTHCIGCIEQYNDSTLIYGQGNFLFDDSDRAEEQFSVVICIDTDNDGERVTYIPIVREKNLVRKAGDDAGREIISEMMERSKEIKNDEFVKSQYVDLVNSEASRYLAILSGGFRRMPAFRLLNKISGHRLIHQFYKGHDIYAVDDIIKCETHREIVLKLCEMIESEVGR